jgi:hypothetical protein
MGRNSNPGRGKNFFLLHVVQTVSGCARPPIQWAPGDFSSGLKRLGREADHSSPPSDKVKKTWIYTSTPPYAFRV